MLIVAMDTKKDEAAAGGMDAAGALATLPPPSYGAALMDNTPSGPEPGRLFAGPASDSKAELRNSYQESAYSPAPTSAYSPYPQASSSSNIPTSASSPPSQHFSYVEPHRATPALSPYPAAPSRGDSYLSADPITIASSMASHQKGNVNAGSGGFMVGNNHPINVSKIPDEETARKKKKWLIVGLIVGILLVLVVVAAVLGVLLSKKSGDGTAASGSAGSGSTAPASTLVPGASSGSPTTPSTTGAVPPSATSTERPVAGSIRLRYNLFPTAGFAINPITRDSFFAPFYDGDRSVREVFFSNGSTKLTLPNAGSPSSFGIATLPDALLVADENEISVRPLSNPSNSAQTITNFTPTSIRTVARIRDSFASADGYLFVLNDEYVSPAQTAKTGIVVIGAPTSPYSFTQVAPTISYPWSAVLVTPTTLIVSLGNGIVQEYLYTTSWSLSRSFVAHTAGVRQLAMSETTGLLYTAGLDARVSVWDLTALATSRGGVATSLATFTGFGGEVYFVGVSEDGSEMAAGGQGGILQVFSGATRGQPPTFRFSVNVGFDIWKIAYHAPSNAWFVSGNTDRPVLVAN